MNINIFKDNFVDNIYIQQKLANHTWFGVGGNAEILYVPEEEKSLEKFLKVKPNDCKVFTIGAGSNLLVRDNGIDGVTLITSKLNKISIMNLCLLNKNIINFNYYHSFLVHLKMYFEEYQLFQIASFSFYPFFVFQVICFFL